MGGAFTTARRRQDRRSASVQAQAAQHKSRIRGWTLQGPSAHASKVGAAMAEIVVRYAGITPPTGDRRRDPLRRFRDRARSGLRHPGRDHTHRLEPSDRPSRGLHPAVGGDQVRVVLHGLDPLVHQVLVHVAGIEQRLQSSRRQQVLRDNIDQLLGMGAPFGRRLRTWRRFSSRTARSIGLSSPIHGRDDTQYDLVVGAAGVLSY